jgi:DNA-binding phage protein
MADSLRRRVHVCRCEECRRAPRGEVAREHRAINRVVAILDERGRRLLVGLLAWQMGHGGVVRLAEITGMSRTTMRRSWLELQNAVPELRGRIRRCGGGRQRVEKKIPGS